MVDPIGLIIMAKDGATGMAMVGVIIDLTLVIGMADGASGGAVHGCHGIPGVVPMAMDGAGIIA